MGNLRSALDEEASVDLARLTGPELAERVQELAVARRRLDALWLGTLRAFDVSGEWAFDGAKSAGAWVAWQTRADHGRTRKEVRLARRLEGMPGTAAALADGALSLQHAAAIAEAASIAGFADAEGTLVREAERLRPDETRRVVTQWRLVVGDETLHDLHERRGLHISATFEGLHVMDACFDVEGGVVVKRAIDDRVAKTPDVAGTPRRSLSQRRADAMVDICDRYLRGAFGTPRRRPHLNVTVGLETLLGASEAPGRTTDGEPLPADVVRRMACDAEITRVILGPDGMPLDVGRTSRVMTPAIRTALELRDGGCSVPGCDLPPEWCDAHHEHPGWLGGVETSAESCALACRRHHTMEQRGELAMTMRGGWPAWFRADGTEITPDPRPPP